jgi:transcriptional regulator with XRE-family HTH domain
MSTITVDRQTATRCAFCEEDAFLIDELGHCEQCILRTERTAAHVTESLEAFVEDSLEKGFTPSQVREMFEMSLANTTGSLAETLLVRQPCEGTRERGIWVTPPSRFLDTERRAPNEIRRARRVCDLSLEAVADELGVPPSELDAWERGSVPPRDHARTLADWFRQPLDRLLGVSEGPRQPTCARCSKEVPTYTFERYEEGWDVAGGTELVCPDCLKPGDLDW